MEKFLVPDRDRPLRAMMEHVVVAANRDPVLLFVTETERVLTHSYL